MEATAVLIDEHRAIKKMLRVAENVAARLDGGEHVPAEDLAAIVEFIAGFADKCHHAKEEGLLFPAMEKAGIPRQGGPIGVMFHEHKEGREFVRRMRSAVGRYSAGDVRAASEFAVNAGGYAALLRRHIDKEDNVLYPMADNVISESGQRDLIRAFENVEEESVGAGEHERFRQILDRLEAAYLR